MNPIRSAYVVCFLLVFSSSLQGGDWPTARGDAQSTGVSQEKLPAEPTLLWEIKPEKSGFEGTPIIVGDHVWLADVEGKVFCLELATGNEVWSSTHKNGFIVSPAYHDGRLVVGDFDGHIYCFDAMTGAVQWEADILQAAAGGANFFKDLVLLTSEAGQLFALDAKTGTQKWDYATGDQLRSSPTLWNQFALLGGCDGRLHKINVETGSAIGEGLLLDGPSGSTPAVHNSTAIVPTQTGQVLAFDVDHGEKMWSFADSERSQEIRSSPSVVVPNPGDENKALAIVTTRNRRVLALDLSNGKLVWEAVVRKRCDASPVVCDGRVWVGGVDGTLYSLDLRTGEERWTYQLSGQLLASPAIAHQRIVVATDKGTVACFGTKQ